jgi:hypothetical protein
MGKNCSYSFSEYQKGVKKRQKSIRDFDRREKIGMKKLKRLWR